MSEERKEELSQKEKTEQEKSSEVNLLEEDIREENPENSYEFIKETIKAKPLDKKKLAKQLGRLAGSGAVFGLAAALVFGALAPSLLEKAKERHNAQKVQFQNGANEPAGESEENQDETQEEDQDEQTTIIQEMTPEDYQALYSDIFSTAENAQKAMVTVLSLIHI